MSPDFSDGLIKIIEQKALTLEFVKDWVERYYKMGKLDNLDYIEILQRLKEYERTQP